MRLAPKLATAVISAVVPLIVLAAPAAADDGGIIYGDGVVDVAGTVDFAYGWVMGQKCLVYIFEVPSTEDPLGNPSPQNHYVTLCRPGGPDV